MKKKFLLFGFLAATSLFSCSSHHAEEKEEGSRFKVSSPIKMDTALREEYVCQIHSIQHIELQAQERGFLQEIYVDEGQRVKKGQLLFKIMPGLYQAEYEKAKAEVDYAEIEYRNTKSLADSNIVAPNELAMARAKLEKAKAELSLANVHLSFTKIHAPFDGIIDRFQVREGSLIEEGDLLTTLSNNSRMWVYYNVPEAKYLDYQLSVRKDSNVAVKLLMANNTIFPTEGKIETIEADFNNETGIISFRAGFDNPQGLLRHGETGSILMSVPLKDALIIPQKATFEVLDKHFVFVVDKENIVHAREITVAAELPHLFAVSSGITEDDTILLDGLRLVKENDKIAIAFQDPKVTLASLDLYAE
jgi:membrane fusion protein (multidrug efflux system)